MARELIQAKELQGVTKQPPNPNVILESNNKNKQTKCCQII